MNPKGAYDWLLARSAELAGLGSAMALMGWDQRTMIPRKGHAGRASAFAALAGIAHEKHADPRIGEMLAVLDGSELLADPLSPTAVNVREWKRSFERAVKIPRDLAVALARAESEGESAWERAKPENDWDAFRPHLEELVRLTREKAEAVGYAAEPYDALLDEYEPGMTAAEIEPVFAALEPGTRALLEHLAASPKVPVDLSLRRFPASDQERFSRAVAARIGYDFEAGRLDVTAHPFSTRIHPGDVRITTRYEESNFGGAFFGTVHETGHALYSMGLPAERFGTPMGSSVSLGVHESQSRLWENFVARSRGFWEYFYPAAQLFFPALAGLSLDDFLLAVNTVKPGLVRVEADEVTYNLHVLLRLKLELALFRGRLQVADLPGAWSESMRELLGLTPPDHATGVMQDVHWSGGAFGYFPTYSLGNIYAAQLYAAADADLGGLEAMFARGEFAPLLGWLRDKVHSQGMRHLGADLVERATGARPDPSRLLDFLGRKYGALYGV